MHFLANIKARLLTCLSPLWYFYLRARGCEVGRKLTCIGRPGINRKRGTLIKLGNNTTLCNSGMANPLAEYGRCRLSTVAKGAKLIIHDHVGLSSTLICAAIRIEIGEGTQIGGGSMILDTDFHPRDENGTLLTNPSAVAKSVLIGRNCFIGARAIILKGVTVGDGATIGAGAVVTRDIPDGAIAAGNPARVVSGPLARNTSVNIS